MNWIRLHGSVTLFGERKPIGRALETELPVQFADADFSAFQHFGKFVRFDRNIALGGLLGKVLEQFIDKSL